MQAVVVSFIQQRQLEPIGWTKWMRGEAGDDVVRAERREDLGRSGSHEVVMLLN